MKIEDFLPADPTFKLEKAPGRIFTLKIPGVSERLRLNEMSGGRNKISQVFAEVDLKEICKFVYFLLVDKTDLMWEMVEQISMEGKPEKVEKTGPDKLFDLIQSNEEGFKMMGAFNAAIALSEPALKKAMEEDIEKKNLLSKSTGDRSSTSSPASTDTPLPSLESSPSDKST